MDVHSILTTRLSPPRGFSSGLIAASCVLVLGQAIVIATLGHRALGRLCSDAVQLALGLICILACAEGYYFSKPLTVDKVADKLRGPAAHPLPAKQGA